MTGWWIVASRSSRQWLVASAVVVGIPTIRADEPPAPDYARDIRPILAGHCFDCHGPNKQQAGLRLDSIDGMKAGGDSGPSINLEKPAESRMTLALRHDENSSPMPLDADPLPEDQIALIERWIAAGAPGVDSDASTKQVRSNHWSFQPIARPKLPIVHDCEWMRQPLDAFLLSRLEMEEITPSPEADPSTLLRRLHLDLVGLLPSPDDVQAFQSSERPDAVEQVVDRLLASPHYGERWGRHWLDVARYADSDGYTIDGPRSMWNYRDWVIDAVARDLPFDQFLTEQLAGDLLPNATLAQRVATGFHRNTMRNEEGGTDDEQFRVEAVVDRVATTGEAILGLTLACAQCHSHKFDPISQQEYYQLFAFFNTADEPTIEVPTEAEALVLDSLRTNIAQLREQRGTRERLLAELQSEWEGEQRAALKRWIAFEPASVSATGGASIELLDDQSVRAGGYNSNCDVYTFVANTDLVGIQGLRLEVLVDDQLPAKGPGRAENGNFILTEFSVRAAPLGDPTQAAVVPLAAAVAEHSQPKYDIGLAIDGDPKTGWAINTPNKKNGNVNRTAHFLPKEPFGFADGTTLVITIEQTSGQRYNVGRFRLSATTQSGPIPLVPSALAGALRTKPEERSDNQKQFIEQAQRSQDADWSALNSQIAALEQQLPTPATTLAIAEQKTPRDTFVHMRGNFLDKGAKVEPGVPSVLPVLNVEGRADRVDLARWLTSEKNPLVARVAVNRIWQHVFGIGLVETDNDFGTQGSPPTHPELLDWLANDFRDGDWSRARLIRSITTSAAYRQSSHARPELEIRDARNRLLARQSRIRLEAEIVRDVALDASGRLSLQVGGPSVFPFQPDGVMVLAQVDRPWKISEGADRYRRGMYTYFWRSTPHPALKVFDAPDAQRTCTRRSRSNTPLQSLTLLNDAAYVECAEGLSERILAVESKNDLVRIQSAFQICVAREPTSAEESILMRLLGESRAEQGASEKQAWTAVTRAILNLDEFITRE